MEGRDADESAPRAETGEFGMCTSAPIALDFAQCTTEPITTQNVKNGAANSIGLIWKSHDAPARCPDLFSYPFLELVI